MVFLTMLHTELYLEKLKTVESKIHQIASLYETLKTLHHVAVVVLCLFTEGIHLVSIKVLETVAEWVHFKFVAVEKLNGRRAGFVAAVRFIL